MRARSSEVEATRFHSATTGFGGDIFGSHTMLDVLQGVAGGENYATLGRYMVASLLNVKSGRSSFIDESTVRRMWNDVVSKGHYEPLPGVTWGPDEIVEHLRSTMA